MFITSSPSSSFAAPSLLFQRQKSATPFTTTPILRENSSKKNSRRISSSSPNMNPFEFTTASRTVFEIDAFETSEQGLHQVDLRGNLHLGQLPT